MIINENGVWSREELVSVRKITYINFNHRDPTIFSKFGKGMNLQSHLSL